LLPRRFPGSAHDAGLVRMLARGGPIIEARANAPA
jgi:hypothetical protein